MATYLVNRIPSKVLKYKTPFEKVYGKEPDLDNLRIWGSLAYATNLTLADKFQPRSIPCVFLGYPNNQKGYLLYNFKNKTIFVSRHVTFVENKFPFKDHSTLDQGGVSKDMREMFLFDDESIHVSNPAGTEAK